MLAWLLTGSVVGAAEKAAADQAADETPPGKVYLYKHSAGKPRQMEIYFPPGHDPAKAKVPGLILFHGGGWSGGSLSQFRRAAQYFAGRGMVAATAEYRMLTREEAAQLPPGETRKRVCVTDARSAIRWFKQQALALGLDPQRIVTGGGSAGGHISALATLQRGLDDPTDPAGIDVSVLAYLWFNPAFAPDDAKDAEIDVLRHVRKELAPAVVFFGTDDTWKPGWDAVHAKLESLGNRTTKVWLAEGMPHGFFNRDPWQTLTLIEADRFLAGLGVLTGGPTLRAPAGPEKLVSAAELPAGAGAPAAKKKKAKAAP